MAREIIRHNASKTKTPLAIVDIIGNDNHGYGVFDQYYRLDMDKISEEFSLVFDKFIAITGSD